MTDIHTHILPFIDDGAENINESFRLLRAEIADGVDTVALTPHFRIDGESIESFIKRRNHSFNLLSTAVKEAKLPITMKLGAEVAFSAALTEHDLAPLCFEGTKTILIELPTEHYPPFTRKVFLELKSRGYRTMIAHIERYPYFVRSPDIAEILIKDGALAQATADSVLFPGKTKRRVMKWIQNGYIHVLATDTHGMEARPPRLGKAVEYVKRKLGADLSAR